MLRTDRLLGDLESVTSLCHSPHGELLQMRDAGGESTLVYVPENDERGRREREMLTLLAFPGVPVCERTIETDAGVSALILGGAGDARPLAQLHDLPPPTLRAGIAALLSVVNFAHSRGFVHGRIDRSTILADGTGRFWLSSWADARPANQRRVPGTLGEVAIDLRDLGRAFREALLRRPWPDPEAASLHDRNPRTAAGRELLDAGVQIDRDFARVLSRLVTCDPREAYTGATDVLADMGAVDVASFDPWSAVPAVGIRREVARVLRLLENTRVAASETVEHAASVDFVGGSGSGKSRLLVEIARAARSRGVIVLTAEGGAGGAWGGISVFARQLVQLVGRGSRTSMQHEESLRHLLGDPEAPGDGAVAGPGPGPVHGPVRGPVRGRDGREPLTSVFSAALTDLVRIAFRHTPGLLLLDDEERLPAAARQVWRTAGQFVQAVNGAGGVLQALLVSASTNEHPSELGADRVLVKLRDWRHADVERYLSRVLASPGGARDASRAVLRVAGPRPGDVVGYLRELERAGALVREGLRWRLTVPLAACAPVYTGGADRVRRAIETCGRDACALAEVIAVAGELTLPRDVVGDICDVRGPRLAAAADAAVSAGLLAVDGASWRVHSESTAHRIYAAIPDDRRRIIHREILTWLLDTTPTALDPIATHARASGDPRAEAWTREAISHLSDKDLVTEAQRHLHALGQISADPTHSQQSATLLRRLGRLAAAHDAVESVGALDEVKSRLISAWIHYDSREWRKVISTKPSEDAHSGSDLAELRLLRAIAYRHLNQGLQAEREKRLALAETPTTQTLTFTTLLLEYEYQNGLYSGNWPLAKSALIQKIRHAARDRDREQYAANLIKLGNAHRYLLHDTAAALPILLPVLYRRPTTSCTVQHTPR